MPSRVGRSLLGLVFLVVSACSSPPGPAESSGAPASAAPPATESSAGGDQGTSAVRFVRLVAPASETFLVRGRYPRVPTECVDAEQPILRGRFPGALGIRRAADGSLSLTVTLPFESYLEGIAEVPPSWPRAALEAQAVAARTYALATTGWTGEEGETLDEPICATTDCQVYRGIPVPPDPTHRRWVAAVRRTAGRVLLHGGRPATTLYFSTSNGRTYGNDEVFGSDPLPYLRRVPEDDDGRSPTSRWRVRIPYRDLERILRQAELWPRGRPIRITRPRDGAVELRGGGASRSIELGDLRDAVNRWAPCLLPSRYPPENGRGETLPLTVPSRWMAVSAADGALVVAGRGWGHGVGMVQWGAYGKARRGASAADILAYYYGGLRPTSYPEPGLIHVRIASGLRALRILPSGPGVRVRGRSLDAEPIFVTGGDAIQLRTGGGG